MIFHLVLKDLKIEWRSKEIITSMFIFGLSITLIFALAFQVAPNLIRTFAPGLLWVVILFTSVLGLNRLFSLEKEDHALWSWVAAPVNRGTVYIAKVISAFIFIIMSELLFIIPFFIFLNLPSNFSFISFALILFLGTGAIVSVGCLISGITLQARLRDVLIPILLFPSASPVAIAATKCTGLLFNQIPLVNYLFWLLILGSFFVIFGLFGYLVFNQIVEE
jgi:heme exporter protein B